MRVSSGFGAYSAWSESIDAGHRRRRPPRDRLAFARFRSKAKPAASTLPRCTSSFGCNGLIDESRPRRGRAPWEGESSRTRAPPIICRHDLSAARAALSSRSQSRGSPQSVCPSCTIVHVMETLGVSKCHNYSWILSVSDLSLYICPRKSTVATSYFCGLLRGFFGRTASLAPRCARSPKRRACCSGA